MYGQVDQGAPLSQGDIIDGCPLLTWEEALSDGRPRPGEFVTRIVVLTQACDLAQAKTTRAVIAVVHDAKRLVASGILTTKVIQDQIRLHRVYGWYFLPAETFLDESIVDLRDVHTVPRSMLEDLIRHGNRKCRIETPYREHLAQHFAITYSRIGLPRPYETKQE